MPTIADVPEGTRLDPQGETQKSRPRKSPKATSEPITTFSDQQIDEIANVFQDRARDARRTATTALLVTIFVGIGILYFFISQSVMPPISPDIARFLHEQLFDILALSTGNIIIRIGAVLIGIFVMQIMVNFVRFNTRMYFHWSMCSALIRLSRGNHLIIVEVASALFPTSITFDKPPTSPSEKVIDGILGSVKEMARKIPNRT